MTTEIKEGMGNVDAAMFDLGFAEEVLNHLPDSKSPNLAGLAVIRAQLNVIIELMLERRT